jgi:hypothetical protein
MDDHAHSDRQTAGGERRVSVAVAANDRLDAIGGEDATMT